MNDNEHLTHLMRRSVDDHEITTFVRSLLPAAGETVRFEHLEIKILRRTRSRLELARVKRL